MPDEPITVDEQSADQPAYLNEPLNPPSITEPVPPTDTLPQEAWDRAIGAWIDAHIRSSPITQGTRGGWEHLLDVLPKLKELLERELKT